MSRLVEIGAFAGIALSLHLGAWVGVQTPGSESQGAGGEDSVSLTTSNGAMAEVVATWLRPVEVLPEVAVLEQPEPAAFPLPTPPDTTTAAVSRSPISQQPLQPDAPTPVPEAEVRTPQPAIHDQSPIALPQMAALQPPVAPQPPAVQQRPGTTLSRPIAIMAERLPDVDTQTPAPPQTAPKASKRPPARPVQQQAAPVVPKQVAAGGTAGANAGAAKTEQTANLSKATRQRLLAQWGAAIRNQVLRHQRYPRGTTATGVTQLRITVTRAGRLAGVVIRRSSGDARLDRAAVAAVKRARFPPAPKGVRGTQYPVDLTLQFKR